MKSKLHRGYFFIRRYNRMSNMLKVNNCIIVIILTLICSPVRAAVWVNDGGSLNIDTTRSASYPSITSYQDKTLVSWHEMGSNGFLQGYVKVHQSGIWTQLGGSLNNDPNATIAGTNASYLYQTAYLTYYESLAGTYQVYVKKSNGIGFESVSGSLNISPAKSAEVPRVAFVGDTPYAVWHERSAGNIWQIYVKLYNGTNWQQVGGSLNMDASKDAVVADIAAWSSTPYVTWYESNGSRTQIYVKHFDGLSWVQDGGGSLNIDTNSNAFDPEIVIFNGTPFVAWQENSGTDQIFVKYLNGSNWQSLGGILNLNPARAAFTPNIAFVGKKPYVAWHENSDTGYRNVVVKYYNGSNWVQEGTALNIDIARDAEYPYLAAFNDRSLFVTWHEYNSSGVPQIYVKHLDVYWPVVAGLCPDHAIPGKTITLDVWGINFDPTLLAKLKSHQGNTVIPVASQTYIDTTHMQCTFVLPSNVIPGKYSFYLENASELNGLSAAVKVLRTGNSGQARWEITNLGYMENAVVSGSIGGVDIGSTKVSGDEEILSSGRTPGVFRWKYQNPGWLKEVIAGSSPGQYFTDVKIGNGNNLGSAEIYCSSSDNHVYQLTPPNWEKRDLGACSGTIIKLLIGPGDNSGINKIYTACSDGNIYQFVKNSTWSSVVVGIITGEANALAIGDGNNDTDFELYAGNEVGGVYQFKFNGAAWVKTTVGNIPGNVKSLIVADGNQDGIQDIYVAGSEGIIYRFTSTISNWNRYQVADCESGINYIIYGDAGNLGEDSLFAACDNGHIYQLKMATNDWGKTDLGSVNSSLIALAIGDSENDNQNELYAIGLDNNLYSYKYTSFVPTPTPIPDFNNTIISEKYIYAAPNPIRGHIANIVIYTNQEAEVRVKIYTPQNREVLSFSKYYSSAGKHEERINISNLANGVYFLLVKAKNSNGLEEKVKKKIAIIK